MGLVTVALETAPGQRLEPRAAASWDRLARAVEDRYGWLPVLTDSVRPYDVQERIFRDRYRPYYLEYRPGRVDRRVWNGVAYYRRPGTAAAAVPGTSNHGAGIAVDVSGLGGFNGARYAELAAIAPEYGWTNDEGRRVEEAWHWTYDADDDQHTREDDDEMNDTQDAALKEILDASRELLRTLVTGKDVPRRGEDGRPWPADLMAAAARLDGTLVKGVTSDWPRKLMESQAKTERDAARIRGLEAAVAALAEEHGAAGGELVDRVLARVDEALEGLTVTLTTEAVMTTTEGD